MARTVTATTPFGTFTRTTQTEYRFVALVEAAEHPERGIVLYGMRKGDPELATCREYTYTYDHRTGEKRQGLSWTYRSRYHAVWSRTNKGALQAAEKYAPGSGRVLGAWPVSAS